MLFNLQTLMDAHELDELVAPFTDEEMDGTAKELPVDKAPGPDGFNGMFIKKCWHMFKHDFIRLFKDFCSNNVDLRSINSSFIALIPKKDNP